MRNTVLWHLALIAGGILGGVAFALAIYEGMPWWCIAPLMVFGTVGWVLLTMIAFPTYKRGRK